MAGQAQRWSHALPSACLCWAVMYADTRALVYLWKRMGAEITNGLFVEISPGIADFDVRFYAGLVEKYVRGVLGGTHNA